MAIYSGTKKVKDILGEVKTDIVDRVYGCIDRAILDEGREYIIPEYQREITWSAENIQILIDDLCESSKFLGCITLSTCEEKKYEVMDGQQRLTVFLMLLTYLNKKVPQNKRYEKLCLIQNNTFPRFNEALKYEFDYKKIQKENKELYEEIVSNDPLNQKEDLKQIWNGIVERISVIPEIERCQLFTALLESDVTVILNKIEPTDTKRKFCADCFIDMNNKSKPLGCIDIIKAYAFKEDLDQMNEKWIKIQKECHELQEVVKYSREDLFFQYFICKVNEQIDYSISKLAKTTYKIKENVEVDGRKYASGTPVWYMFRNPRFYSKLLEDLSGYLDFIKDVIASADGRSDKFKKYFRMKDGNMPHETRIVNTHSIINAILRSDDVVPKMMVLKYYLEVLKPGSEAKKDDYKIINQINLIANVFTMRHAKKGSEKIAAKLLRKDWKEALKELANEMILEIPGKIDFGKIMKLNKKCTPESGQYAAKRYIAMRDAYSFTDNDIRVDEEVFKNINSTNIDKNIEHFIINRKFVYALYKDDGKTVDVEIKMPTKYKKYIATIANYLILNSNINAELANRPVYEKIEILEARIQEKGLHYVIPSKRSQLHYYMIKKVFHDESRYPAELLKKAVTKKEKQELLKKYYREDFENEFNVLVMQLKDEKSVLASKTEKS